MSSIIKLSILGVRAFDNHDRELIAFGKPLTLIAGPNGVGKTTIIECLKYATTGDLPPNSKGGAFVHDPRMSGEREVLAQVKLSFYSTSGVQMVCTRSMQLTVKKTTQTFKTLEGQLLAVSGDKKQTVSSKCADLDIQIPHSLGVSPAVLNYVIFCHQEDSLWPLAEPSVVKKRFDEIFEATKFTKALDNIKSLRKDYGADIKVQEKTAQYLEADQERATKLRSHITELTANVQAYEHECAGLKVQIEEATIRLNKLFEVTRGFEQKFNQLSQLRDSDKHIERSIETLLQGLEILDAETAQIQEELESFDSREKSLHDEYAALQAAKKAQTDKIQSLRQDHAKLILKQGKVEAENEVFENQKSQLADLRARTVQEHGKFEGDLGKKLSALAFTATQRYEQCKTENRDKENKLQSTVNQASASKLQLDQQIQHQELKIKQIEAEIRQIASEVSNRASVQAQQSQEHHESLLSNYKTKLAEAGEKLLVFSSEKKIEQAQQQVFAVQAEIELANRALARATQLFGEHSRLMVLKDNAEKKQTQAEALKESLRETYQLAVGKPLDPKTLDHDFTTERAGLELATEASREKVQQLSEKLGITKSKLDSAIKEKESFDSQAKSLQQLVESSIDGPISTFDALLSEVREDLQVATQNMEQSSFSFKYYEAAKTNADQNSCCLLCQRTMDQNEKASFTQSLAKKIASMPITEEEAVSVLEEARKEADRLQALVPKVSRFKALTESEIEMAKQKVAGLEKEHTEFAKRLEEAQATFEEAKRQSAKLDSLRPAISELVQVLQDLDKLNSEIPALAESAAAQDSETPQQVQVKLTELNKRGQHLQSELQNLKDEEVFLKEEKARWAGLVGKMQLELKNMELESQSIKIKQRELKGLQEKLSRAQAELPQLRESLDAALKELDRVSSNLESAKTGFAAAQSTLEAAKSELQSFLEEYRQLSTDINAFESRHGPNPLGALGRELDDLEKVVAKESSELDQLENSLTSADRRITDFRGQRRVLQDNLQLRTYRQEKRKVASSIQTLEKELAETNKDECQRQTLDLQDHCSKLNSSYSSKLGEIKQIQEQVVKLEQELADDYVTVEEDFRRASVKLESTVVATEDLNKYLKALDAAIMQYHSVKMREINQVLDELWKKTYKGTDVDTIMIKGESEGKGARTYNYRVCMVKQDTELDMRGRCSAGQKVLASVIIRLALSECFGTSCGLIVLDEPTTNLDRENSEALARSLSTIIAARRAQRNFQLIVISHDEHFLSCMNAAAYCDHFYRIDRDMRQMSRIERLPIGLLQ